MKTIEYNYGGDWRDKLLNSWPWCVDSYEVDTLFAFAFCKSTFGWTSLSGELSQSLFYNGTFFARYTLSPLTDMVWLGAVITALLFSPWFLLAFLYGLCFQISWKETGNRRYLQAGFLHKLNGRLGLLFRVPKNDAQSSKGAHENAPNSGQATGWFCGTK